MQQSGSGFGHPLKAPVGRLLTAIERFDGPDGRRGPDTARQVRLAMQHLLSVAETDGGSGAAEVIRLLTRDVVYATGWSASALGSLHVDLQFVLDDGDPVV
jgi:hypothetical protein